MLSWLPRFLIRGYQVLLSPWLPPSCRYSPTCSVYALEAYRVHGCLKGTVLTLLRLLRCHPWSACGFDPVPPPGAWRHPDRQLRRP
jgi:hypothetical protein